jgi:hypothetical protein
MSQSKVVPAPTIPDLLLPDEWAPVFDAWPKGPSSELVANIGRAREAGLVAELTRVDPGFTDALRDSLAGRARCVTVSLRDPDWTPAVVSALGVLLGEVDYAGSAVLGGAVREVPTGGTNRYEQTWHSDSVQWTVPNHWTVLGMHTEDPDLRDCGTGILPWDDVLDAWTDDEKLLDDLRRHDIPWRIWQPEMPAVAAPIRGTVSRWFKPLMEKVAEDGSHPATRAILALDAALDATNQWREAVVTPNQVLIFDNHQALHRGPHVPKPSIRTLLRLKVSGQPEG